MGTYLLRRCVHAIPVLFGISIITYLLVYFLPADPARMYAGPSATAATVANIRRQLGLDQPFYVQYGRYLLRVLSGDFGFSYKLQMPVLQAILARLPYTILLTAAGIFVELLIGLPLGMLAALRPRSWLDRGAMLLTFFAVAAPPFWLGLLLLYFFAFKLPLFPLGGTGSLRHLVLPALAAGLGGSAWYARIMRSSMLEALQADYVRTAQAKGLRNRVVVLRHVLRNAFMPILTMIGTDIPWFISGVVLIEAVFAWPGMGKLAVDAIRNVDVPLILGTVLFTAIVVVVANIITDLLYGVLDPRIRHSD